jgi:signal recognition particle GTPase
MRIPVKFIGIGERAKDLALFSADEFVDSLLSD